MSHLEVGEQQIETIAVDRFIGYQPITKGSQVFPQRQ
jgi:hypothetical protein